LFVGVLQSKAAFRVGIVLGAEWDIESIGIISFASGNFCVASGHVSAALGYDATASGDFPTAFDCMCLYQQ
jgi:hypothetical protein